MRTRFTLGEFRSLGHALLAEVKKQEDYKLLKPGAHAQVQWTLLQMDQRLEALPEIEKPGALSPEMVKAHNVKEVS